MRNAIYWIDLFCGAGGTKTNQLKFIGNSVVPLMAQKLVESNYKSILFD